MTKSIDVSSRRTSTSEQMREVLSAIDNTFGDLIDQIVDLQEISADSCEKWTRTVCDLKIRLDKSKDELRELKDMADAKRAHDLNEVTMVYQEQFEEDMDSLIRENITLPELKLHLYWDHLKIRIEPSSSGGVLVVLGFPHSSRLADLQFILQCTSEGLYGVPECDPMVIGLVDLVDRLNSDTRPGALARFCCRMRSTYTCQYSTDM